MAEYHGALPAAGTAGAGENIAPGQAVGPGNRWEMWSPRRRTTRSRLWWPSAALEDPAC